MEIAIGVVVVLIIFGVIGIMFLATSCVACCCSELGLAPVPVPAPVFRNPPLELEKHTINVYINRKVEGQTQVVNMRAEGAPAGDNVV